MYIKSRTSNQGSTANVAILLAFLDVSRVSTSLDCTLYSVLANTVYQGLSATMKLTGS